MKHDSVLDEIFGCLLPSAPQQEVEEARWRILERVRVNIAAGQEAVTDAVTLNHGHYHILMALENAEGHAFAIALEVEAITEGATRFGPGTLFTSIRRLLMDGLIEETHRRPDPRVDDEPRQYYRLTQSGRRVLARESARLAARLFHAQRQQPVRSI